MARHGKPELVVIGAGHDSRTPHIIKSVVADGGWFLHFFDRAEVAQTHLDGEIDGILTPWVAPADRAEARRSPLWKTVDALQIPHHGLLLVEQLHDPDGWAVGVSALDAQASILGLNQWLNSNRPRPDLRIVNGAAAYGELDQTNVA